MADAKVPGEIPTISPPSVRTGWPIIAKPDTHDKATIHARNVIDVFDASTLVSSMGICHHLCALVGQSPVLTDWPIVAKLETRDRTNIRAGNVFGAVEANIPCDIPGILPSCMRTCRLVIGKLQADDRASIDAKQGLKRPMPRSLMARQAAPAEGAT